MEDLWKDIQLSSLHENLTANSTPTVFQDFLSLRPTTTDRGGGRDHNEEEDHSTAVISTPCFMSSINNSRLEPSASSASSHWVFLSCSTTKNKRVSEDLHKTDDSGSDRRHKRMMKNRESAARSRARRQAYTNELEMEIAQLMEENAELKKEQKKLLLCAPEAENKIPKKPTHTRSFTAPF